jgi:hypothetical protein
MRSKKSKKPVNKFFLKAISLQKDKNFREVGLVKRIYLMLDNVFINVMTLRGPLNHIISV